MITTVARLRGGLMLRTSTHNPPSYGIRARLHLPDETRVGGVTLQVSDLQRSVDYYSNVLGMALLEREGTVARMGVAGSGRQLAVLREKPGIARAPRAGRFGLYHFAVLLPDRP